MLEHDFGGFLSVLYRVVRSFCQQYRVLAAFGTELLFRVEVLPDIFHVTPVVHNAVFDRVQANLELAYTYSKQR